MRKLGAQKGSRQTFTSKELTDEIKRISTEKDLSSAAQNIANKIERQFIEARLGNVQPITHTSAMPSNETFSVADMIETINRIKEATRIYRYVASFHVDKGNPVYHDIGRYRLFFVNPDDVAELAGNPKPISLEEMLEITRIQQEQWATDVLKIDFEKWEG